MRRGDLVPDAIVLAMIAERARCLHCGGGFLLDGLAQCFREVRLVDRRAIPGPDAAANGRAK